MALVAENCRIVYYEIMVDNDKIAYSQILESFCKIHGLHLSKHYDFVSREFRYSVKVLTDRNTACACYAGLNRSSEIPCELNLLSCCSEKSYESACKDIVDIILKNDSMYWFNAELKSGFTVILDISRINSLEAFAIYIDLHEDKKSEEKDIKS